MSHLVTKPTKWSVRPAKTQISLGFCPVWSVFAIRMKKAWIPNYPLSAQRRLWSDWADAQADLSLHWAHSHIVGFVMRRLISILKCIQCSMGNINGRICSVFSFHWKSLSTKMNIILNFTWNSLTIWEKKIIFPWHRMKFRHWKKWKIPTFDPPTRMNPGKISLWG